MGPGSILGVGTNHELYTRESLTSPWVETSSTTGGALDVTQLADGTFLGVTNSGGGELQTKSTLADPWKEIQGSGDVIAVTQLQDGTLLGVGANSQLHTASWPFNGWTNPDPNQPGRFIDVAQLKDGTILGVGTGHQLYTMATLEMGLLGSYQEVPNSGDVLSVAVLANGILLGVGTGNDLYVRVTLLSAWKEVPTQGAGGGSGSGAVISACGYSP